MGGYIYEAHFEYRDILMLGKSPIKWRQRPDMTIAVDRDVMHEIKQTKQNLLAKNIAIDRPLLHMIVELLW